MSLPLPESDSSYPFLLQTSCSVSGNEGAGAREQEEAKFYGRTAAARPGEVGNREKAGWNETDMRVEKAGNKGKARSGNRVMRLSKYS